MKTLVLTATLLLVSAMVGLSSAGNPACSVMTSKGLVDLTPLSTIRDYVATDDEHRIYHIAICSTVLSDSHSECKNDGACQTTAEGKQLHHLGASSNPTTENDVVMLQYTGGDTCHQEFQRSLTIVFECSNVEEGPVFEEETASCEYRFTWRSKYACAAAQKPTETLDDTCRYHDQTTGETFDLSPLRKLSNDWIAVDDADTESEREYKVNVCQKLQDSSLAGTACEGFAGCQIDHNSSPAKYNGLGKPSSTFTRLTGGRVSLTYNDGKVCTHNGLPRSMQITFECLPGSLGAPKFLREIDCQYEFLWKSSAACPIEDNVGIQGGDCRVRDAVSNALYDLSSLKDDDITVIDKSYTYTLHVCGPVQSKADCADDNVGVCQVSTADKGKKKGKVVGLASSHPELKEHDLVLKYEGGAKCHGDQYTRSATITFVCDPSVAVGSPVFVEETADCSYLFSWTTALACTPLPGAGDDRGGGSGGSAQSIECVAEDPANNYVYDLTSLMRNSGNWEAVDDSDTRASRTLYYLSVCQPLNPIPNSHCPAGAAACVLSGKVSAQTSKSLGLPASPKVTQEGKLILEYDGGEGVCDDGNTRPSVRIEFVCKQGSIGTPAFFRKTDRCQYQFMWESSVACVVKETASKDDCKLTVPALAHTFDFSSLASQNHIVSHVEDKDKYEFDIAVCSAVPKSSGCSENAGVCQRKLGDANFHRTVGLFSKTLHYEDGVVSLFYNSGDYCSHSKANRSVEITFQCSEENGEPMFVSETDCSYSFIWSTPLACVSRSVECVATDPATGTTYDLQALQRSDTNWVTSSGAGVNAEGDGFKYLINVCQPVNVGSTTCSPTAGACQIDTKTSKSHSLGLVTDGPKVNEDGVLQIRYTGGDLCHKNFSRAMVINFGCDATAGLGAPVFVSESAQCVYQFQWQTSAACSPEELNAGDDDGGSTHPPTELTCTARDSVTDDVYDLSSFKGKTYTVNADDYVYTLGICAPVGCGDNHDAAACQKAKTGAFKSLGQYKSSPESHNDLVTLEYSQGDLCHSSNVQRSTFILFICDIDAGEGTPEFLDEDSCTYNFIWRTKLVCSKDESIDCTVVGDNGALYDLAPLMNFYENWEVSAQENGDTYLFEINVCKPVVGGHCTGSSGACQSKPSAASFKAKSLGPPSSPKLVNGELQLVYSPGDVCHGIYNRSAVITFKCARGTYGVPEYLYTTAECEYHFQWPSLVACDSSSDDDGGSDGSDAKPSGPAHKDRPCTVTNTLTDEVFDFSGLSSKTYTVTAGDYTFDLGVCKVIGANSECGSSAAACQHKPSDTNFHRHLGLSNSVVTTHDGVFRLVYPNGSPCHSGQFNRSTEIVFTCSRSAGTGTPKFTGESDDCVYQFEWATSLACPATAIECSATDSATGYTFDLSPLVGETENWEVSSSSDTDSYVYFINICRPLIYTDIDAHPGLGSCSPHASACQTKPSAGENAFPGKTLGLSSAPTFKDGHVMITYENGDSCHGDTYQRTTEIVFKCHRGSLGEPRFLGETDDCVYQFEWATSVVCTADDHDATPPPPTPAPPAGSVTCSVIDTTTGTEYDFEALGAKDVQVKTDDYDYNLRLCHAAEHCGDLKTAGACQVIDASKTKSLGNWHTQQWSAVNGVVKLTMTSGDSCHQGQYNRSTIISFICDESVPVGAPEFVSESSDCSYMFLWRTQVACVARSISCTVSDASHIYDLSPLMRAQGEAWIANDLGASVGSTFYLSVCQPIGGTNNHGCPSSSGACDVSNTGNSPGKSLGQISGPKLENGRLTVEYTHGAADGECTERTTVIMFMCAHGRVGEPVFLEAFDCTFYFEWETDAACPVEVNGHKAIGACKTIDGTGQEYDLSVLSTKPYSVKDGTNYNYDLAICKSLDTCSSPNSAACQSYTDKQNKKVMHSLGQINDRVIYAGDGELELRYTNGEPCHNGAYNRSTVITFECDLGAGLGTPTFVAESTECAYRFQWSTSLACNPNQNIECLAVDDATHQEYDLTPLIRGAGQTNWRASAPNTQFEINICHSLIPSDDSGTCPLNTGSCQTQNGKSHSAGFPAGPKIVNGDLVLLYENGEVCSNKKARTTLIIFECKAGSLGAPVFREEKDCQYIFDWKSSVACAPEIPPSKPDDKLGNCVAVDPETGVEYDMRLLTAPNGYRVSTDEYQYDLNICGSVTGPCAGTGIGVCQSKPNDSTFHKSLGLTNSRLTVTEGVVSLFYVGGDLCHGTTKRSTLITFSCDPTATAKPVVSFVGETGCSYVFEVKTSEMCLTSSGDCTVQDPTTKDILDFSALSSTSSYKVENSNFVINVCEPVRGSNCASGAGACSPGVLNAGVATAELTALSTANAYDLVYKSGLPCNHDEGQFSTIIHFTCKSGTIGRPVLFKQTPCSIEVNWETAVACGNAGPIKGTKCQVKNALGDLFDLSGLKRAKTNYVATAATSDGRTVEFQMNVCGPIVNAPSHCQNAAICDITNNLNLGNPSDALSTIDEEVMLEYADGSQCPAATGTTASSVIVFECNANAGIGHPEFIMKSSTCQYVFEWESAFACANNKAVNPGGNTNTGVGGGGSHAGLVVGILILVAVVVLAVVVLRKPRGRKMASKLWNRCNFCRRPSQYSSVSYTTLGAGTDLAHLMDEDDDDDLLTL